jgi:tRNA(Ile)-lysidine synthase TilS/MesJ
MKGGYTVFRPMIRYNSNDIEKHVHEMGIPTLKLPCRFSDFRPKRALEQYYQKMESRFDYDRVISFAKQALGLPGVSSYHSIEAEEYLLNVF